MVAFTRRSLAGGLAAGLGAAVLPKPGRAAGQTVAIWWNQGFYPAEDRR